jgi:hypothetical protein
MLSSSTCEYDAASQSFRDLRGAFMRMHYLIYAQYIERIEAGLKSNPRCFLKFVSLKRNSSGFPSAMFLTNIFGEYYQGVYVRDDSQEDFVVDNGVEDSSTVSLIQLEKETVKKINQWHDNP